MDKDSGLALTFLEQAHDVGMGLRRYMEVAPGDLLKIARNPASCAEFKRQLALIDVDLQRQLMEYIADLADSGDDDANEADRRVDLLDRAGKTVSASVTVAGIGTVIASVAHTVIVGSLLGPVGMMVGGIGGLIATGIGRTALKRRSDRSKSDARKLRRLVS